MGSHVKNEWAYAFQHLVIPKTYDIQHVVLSETATIYRHNHFSIKLEAKAQTDFIVKNRLYKALVFI